MLRRDYSFAGTTVLLSFLALILGLGVIAAPSSGHSQSAVFIAASSGSRVEPTLYLHAGGQRMLAIEVIADQDAGAATPATQAGPAPEAPSAATPSSGSPAQPKKVELPEGDGKAIAMEFCQDCHRLTNLTRAHKSEDDWHETVQTMMDQGARLPKEDVDLLVKYLATNFPPKAASPDAPTASASPTAPSAPGDVTPTGASASAGSAPAGAPVNAPTGGTSIAAKVELPDGDGKAIAMENCQACHKLTNLLKAHKDLDDWRDTLQLMIDRGATVPADQVETLVQYLAKNFGPLPAGAPIAGAGTNTSPQSQGAAAAPAAH